jgi:hypothetical protein
VRIVRRLSVVALLLLLPISVPSSTPRILWMIYDAQGHVTRPEGSLSNHAVVLMSRCERSAYGTFTEMASCESGENRVYGPFVHRALTDDTGAFHLRVPSCVGGCDSVVVAVVLPDTTILAELPVGTTEPRTVEKREEQTESGFYCAVSTGEFVYVDAYIYEFPETTVPIP